MALDHYHPLICLDLESLPVILPRDSSRPNRHATPVPAQKCVVEVAHVPANMAHDKSQPAAADTGISTS
jgi:hypothetical protein